MPGASWGDTAAERARPLPCDGVLDGPHVTYHRAIGVDAPAPVLFRWLCQLRAAPYSYDWLDNRGRRSPRELTPGLERLERGQTVMTIFELLDFEPGRSLTLRSRRVACTYDVAEAGPGASRLLVRMHVRLPGGALGRTLLAPLAAPGELVMMRKQLRTLKGLAERGWSRPPAR